MFHDVLSSAEFFHNYFFQKCLSGIIENQTVWIQIRPDVLSDLGPSFLFYLSADDKNVTG